ncbi:MAG: xanthine phosphoribosyltransferase [Bdellovibrionales bacterium]
MKEHPSSKFYPVNWDELHRNGKALAWRLLDKGPWKGIVAISRGGLVPAAIVARELDVHVIETVSVVGYHADDSNPMQEERIEIVKPAANVGDGEGWLVIDDLVDTGRTMELLRTLMPKAHYAAIYAKPKGKPQVNTFITEVSQDTWIYFPWDIESQFIQPIALREKAE